MPPNYGRDVFLKVNVCIMKCHNMNLTDEFLQKLFQVGATIKSLYYPTRNNNTYIKHVKYGHHCTF